MGGGPLLGGAHLRPEPFKSGVIWGGSLSSPYNLLDGLGSPRESSPTKNVDWVEVGGTASMASSCFFFCFSFLAVELKFSFWPLPISIFNVTLFSANAKKRRQVGINKLGLKLNRGVDPRRAEQISN